MRNFYISVVFFAISLAANAQIIDIPDANFKNALVNTMCVYDLDIEEGPIGDVDTNDNGEIELSEAIVVEWLNVENQNIASLSGIENFTALMILNCSNNQLTSIDVEACSYMFSLNCSNNQITSIAVDFWQSPDYETSLNASNNSLTDYTVPQGGIYYSVNLSNNLLTSVTIPPASNVYSLTLSNNPFTTVDAGAYYLTVSNCPIMTTCNLTGSHVTVGNNPQLLSASFGSLGTYEVHNNPLLQSIDLKDGVVDFIDSGNIYNADFNFQDNPSLEFVCVDDAGRWYDEGGDEFFQPEIIFVDTDPGVNITYYCDLMPGGGYNTITGTFHYDCGGTNSVIDGQVVTVNLDQASNGSVEGTATPDNTGSFYFYASGSGTIEPNISSTYFTISPPNLVYTFPGSGATQNVDFCITPNGVHNDLSTSIIPVMPPRPGFEATYIVKVMNQGTEIQSGTITFAFDDSISDFVIAAPSVNEQSENLLSWNFANLAPLTSQQFDVTLNINSPVETPAVNIGDLLNFTSTVSGASDETPNDNIFELSQRTVGAFDPNDKSVSRETIGISELSEFLYYTVRFQNTGNFYAENVVIRDMLSEFVDISTFEIIASSHPCHALLTPQNLVLDGDRLEFFFEGINLPAETDDEPGSHGFVTYKIKPLSTLVLNDVIQNTAEIYFDFNSAIVTNTVSTTVTNLATTEFNAEDSFTVYPNPAGNYISVKALHGIAIKSLAIYNLIGQRITLVTENTDSAIDISAFEKGTHLLQITTDSGVASKKLIKR